MVRGRKNVISYFSRKRHGLGHAVSHFITSFKNKVHKVEENADVLPLFLSGVSMSISACGQDRPNNPTFKRVLHQVGQLINGSRFFRFTPFAKRKRRCAYLMSMHGDVWKFL